MSLPNTPRRGLSKRDRRRILAVALFAEVVLLYMLLLDPLLTRLSRSRELELETRRAHGELSRAVSAREPGALVASESISPLLPAERESSTMAVQRALGDLASRTGVRLIQARVASAGEAKGELEVRQVDVELEGPYEAIASFIEDLEAPAPVRGVELFAISTSETDSEHLKATMALRFYLPKP